MTFGGRDADALVQLIQTIAEILGIILILVKAIKHAGRIEERLDSMSKSITEHSRGVQRILDDHETRIRDVEGQVDRWRGEERRHGVDDRRATGG